MRLFLKRMYFGSDEGDNEGKVELYGWVVLLVKLKVGKIDGWAVSMVEKEEEKG